MSTDEQRQWAESFGANAERFDRARPRYPSALVERILWASPGVDVLDVGCGTGILARQFQAAGAGVVGVDVDDRMAEVARRFGLDVEVSRWEDWDPAGRVFDIVVAGQTWHWMDPVAGAAKAAQALRRGGRLAVCWNVGQPPPEVARGLAAAYARVLPAGHRLVTAWTVPAMVGYEALFRQAADGITEVGRFTPPERWRYHWEWTYTRAAWLDQLGTAGGHSLLSPEQYQELSAGVAAAIDAVGGGFTMDFTTVVVTAVRR